MSGDFWSIRTFLMMASKALKFSQNYTQGGSSFDKIEGIVLSNIRNNPVWEQ